MVWFPDPNTKEKWDNIVPAARYRCILLIPISFLKYQYKKAHCGL